MYPLFHRFPSSSLRLPGLRHSRNRLVSVQLHEGLDSVFRDHVPRLWRERTPQDPRPVLPGHPLTFVVFLFVLP